MSNSNSAQHTPGPWKVVTMCDPATKHTTTFITTKEGWEICTMRGCAEENANARAMSVVPELLDKARALSELVTAYERDDPCDALRRAADAVDAAIAKAGAQ